MRLQLFSLFISALLLTCVSTHKGHSDDDLLSHKCVHDEMEHPELQFLDVEERILTTENQEEGDQEGRNLASTTYPYLRIYPYYGYLSSSTPASYATYIKTELMPPVFAFFEKALRVKAPIAKKITVSSAILTLCGKAVPSVLRSGVTADLFISLDTSYDSAGSWVAQSSPCFLSATTNRPLVGKSLLNRYLLKDATTNVLLHEKNIYCMLHEITHILGFSYGLYPYFISSSGKKLTGHLLTRTLDGATSVVVNVAPLTAKLRSFFGCSTLAGAYMENSGSTATAGSHFERRQFVFEAMTSGLIYQQRYSQFSLAMLEGSGWYVANYDYAEPYWFGQGQGCNFLTKSCSSSGFSYEEFCPTKGVRGCTSTGRGGGSCSADIRSDGCKFQYPNVNYDCENSAASSYARLPSLQKFGRTAGSKCFEGTLSASTASASSFCFTYTCSGSGSSTKLAVKVGTSTVYCTKAGNVSISGYKGYITCPNPLEFCSTVGLKYCPRNCMGRGICSSSGTCSCYKGYKGVDCSLTI